jgi:hypothetical protein
MKKLLIILSIITLNGCKEKQPDTFVQYNFIVKEKVSLNGDFYIRSSKDVVLPCSAKQYIGWDVGDTIPMKLITSGFYGGTHVLDTNRDM